MNITLKNIQILIKKAIENDACKAEIKVLKNLKTLDDFINHPDAPYWCFWVANHLMCKRWLEAEYIIARNFSIASEYATCVMDDRWDAVENNLQSVSESDIHSSSGSCYYYAKDCIQGRWEKAESIIIQSIYYSVYYAINVLKYRWYKLEEIIKENMETEFPYLNIDDQEAIIYYQNYFNIKDLYDN